VLRFAVIAESVRDHRHLKVAHIAVDAADHHTVVREYAADDDLIAVHKEAANFKLENQKAAATPIPYHPGAIKYLAERGIKLEISDSALDLLGNAGFDPVYGARPLKRAIQQQVENPLAQRILRGEFRPGDRIAVTVHQGELVFAKG